VFKKIIGAFMFLKKKNIEKIYAIGHKTLQFMEKNNRDICLISKGNKL
jgi:hypothetical protein